MCKLVSLSIVLILLCATARLAAALDQSQVAQNDCFERLVMEAMIPFDRAHRTIDTNSIRECENVCKSEGNKCQAFALGVDPRGNGTCQLTGVRIDASSGRLPAGVIYDPIFDIYQRHDCMDASSSPTTLPASTTTSGTTFSSQRPSSEQQPSTVFLPTMTFSHTPPATVSGATDLTPPTTIVSTQIGIDTRPTTNRMPTSGAPISSTSGKMPDQTISFGSRPPNDPTSSRYPPENRYPPTERYPVKDRYPSSKYPEQKPYGNGNTYSTMDKMRPLDDSYQTNRPATIPFSYGSYGLLNDRDPSQFGQQDKFNFYQDLAPTYAYPMLYETNYPLPNDKDHVPNYYAQNVPTVPSSYYRPTYSSTTPQQSSMPALGYGQTTSNTMNHRPTGVTGSSTFSGNPYLPTASTNVRPPTTPSGYYDRDDRYNRTDRYGNRYPTMSGISVAYRPTGQSGYDGGGNTQGSSYQVTEEPIETYFNPDDYIPNARKLRYLFNQRYAIWVRT